MPEWRTLIRARLRTLRLDPHVEADIVEELSVDLEERYRELVARGQPSDAAAEAVLAAQLSDDALAEAIGATVRAARSPRPALGADRADESRGTWALDLRYAVRSLLHTPGLTVVVLLTLAIGVGANIAIFGVVNALLLRPLPFHHPGELVAFLGTAPAKGLPIVAYPDVFYDMYRKRLSSLDPVAMYTTSGVTLTGAGDAARVESGNVTADFFKLLGVAPIAGRTFRPEEETAGKTGVAVLGYGLWQRRFGGQASVLGRSVLIDRLPYTVVGIMPPRFDFPERSELWSPLEIHPEAMNCWCYTGLGRLRPGLTPAGVVREIDALNDAFWTEREPGRAHTAHKPGDPAGTIVTPLGRFLAGEIRTPALVLLGAVAMVLLIACANLANLALGRAASRSREVAVRAALGASPRRIARQLLTESLVLSISGTALGLGLAVLGIRALERASTITDGPLSAIPIDGTVLAFTLVLAVGTGLAFGVLPAVRGAGIDLAPALRDGNRGTGDAQNRRLNNGFVVAQLALSLVLLIGAGLLLKSFSRLLAVDLGFRTENVVVGRVGLPWSTYRPPEIRRFAAGLIDRLSAVHGVSVAAIASTAPFSSGNNQEEVYVEGHEIRSGEPIPVTSVRYVSPGYFDAVGTQLVSGRRFTPADRDSAEQVAIIDQTLARRYWPDKNPIGARISLGQGPERKPEWRTIVGVATTIRHRSVSAAPDHYVYVPLDQQADPQFDVVIRTTGDPSGLIGAARQVVKELDPNVPLYDVHPLAAAVDKSLAARRLTNVLLAGFAVLAGLLAAIGIYGVMARNVAARTREFGVRLALGATGPEVRGMVLRQAARLVAIGAALGLVGAALLTRLLRGLLFGVDPFDGATFAAAAIGLGGIALAACYLPARRATTADPLVALRTD